MANKEMLPNFRRGVLSIIILSLLKQEDMYGYQLVQETNRQTGGRIITQEGSLYPVLYKLLDMGLISDRRVKSGIRMTRVYYHLEPAGETYLEEAVREYESITQGVMGIIHREEGMADAKAFCADEVLSSGEEMSPLQAAAAAVDRAADQESGLGLADRTSNGALCGV